MTDNEVVFESATGIARRIRDGELSALEVLDAHIRRIERLNPVLNAFVTTAFDQARAEAREADERLSKGGSLPPMHGVPVSVKDAIDTAGIRTVVGTRLLSENVPQSSAAAVGRLQAAGAIVLGKTNVPECALDWRTDNPVFGRTNNPWNLEYVPGGSSGGEAAAVSSGCSALGLGSDLGGSIRVPAHFCGICGLRPTPGRIPASGFALLAQGPFSLVNTPGPLARSVDDLELALGVLAGFDSGDPVSVALPQPGRREIEPREVRVLACIEGGIPVTSDTREAVDRAARLLAECGAEIAWGSLPAVAEVPRVFSDWVIQPALPAFLSRYHGREDAMGPLMRGLANVMRPLPMERFLEAWAARNAIRSSVLERVQHRQALLLPVCSTPAFRHDHRGLFHLDDAEVGYTTSFGWVEIASIAGLPALTLPVGRSSSGLPVGVQLVGRPFDEPLLLAIARLLEQAAGSFGHPPV